MSTNLPKDYGTKLSWSLEGQAVIASVAKQSLPGKEIASSLAAPRNDMLLKFRPRVWSQSPKDYAASEKLAPLVQEIKSATNGCTSWQNSQKEAAELARKIQANFVELGI